MNSIRTPLALALGLALVAHATQARADHEADVGLVGERDYVVGEQNVFSNRVGALRDHPIAYVLHAGEAEFSLEGLTMNESVDVFGLRGEFDGGDELGGVLNASGEVGDLSGGRMLFTFGITRDLTWMTELGKTSLRYGTGDVELSNHRLSARYAITRDSDISPATAVELSFRSLQGSNFELGLKELEVRDLRELIDLRDGDSFPLTGVKVIFAEEETLTFGGLTSEEWRARFLMSNQFRSNFFGHLHLGYESNAVDSELSFNLPVLEEFKDLTQRRETETQVGVGGHWTPHARWVFAGFFEANFVSHDKKMEDAPTSNRILTLEALYRHSPDWLVGLSAKMFSNFYLGEAPFLMNENTSPLFEHPYGHVGVSLTVPFDTKRDRRFVE